MIRLIWVKQTQTTELTNFIFEQNELAKSTVLSTSK